MLSCHRKPVGYAAVRRTRGELGLSLEFEGTHGAAVGPSSEWPTGKRRLD